MKSISKLAVLSATLSIVSLTAYASANSISGTSEDNEPHSIEKLYAQNTLQVLGIDAETDSITSSH